MEEEPEGEEKTKPLQSSANDPNGGFLHPSPSWASDPMLAITKEHDSSSTHKHSEPSQSPEMEPESSEEPCIGRQTTTGEVYSVFTVNQKRAIILTGSLASFFSPLSSSIYYPSLPTIATDLHVSDSQINLTVTTYLVCLSLPAAKNLEDSQKFRSSKDSRQ